MSDELISEIEVALTTPVPYKPAGSGEMVDATKVVLTAPSSKQLQYTVILKQGFFQALGSISDNTKPISNDDKQIEMRGEDILSMMFMADNVEMTKIFLAAKELFRSGVAKLDGIQELNQPLIDKISAEDFEKILGEYLVNFILASALKNLNSLG